MDGAGEAEGFYLSILMPLQTCKLCGSTGDSRNIDKHHQHRRSKHTIDITIPLCRSCHIFVENNPAFAKEHGLLDYHKRYETERQYHQRPETDQEETQGAILP